MLWLVRLLLRISRPYFHLYNSDGSLYMGRYTLACWKRLFHIRLHHLATADLDRDMHDHPWTFLSIVLNGGYTEERIGRRYVTRGTGSIALRRYFDIHQVTSVKPQTWTLVFCGPTRRPWGFYPVGRWIHYKDYKYEGFKYETKETL